MSRARRTPPLFEAVGESYRGIDAQGRSVVHAPAAHGNAGAPPSLASGLKRPVIVESPQVNPDQTVGLYSGRLIPLSLLAAAVMILIGFVIWSVGYSRGENAGKRSMVPHTTPEDAAVFTGNTGPVTPLPVQPRRAGELPTGELPKGNGTQVNQAGNTNQNASKAATAPSEGMPRITGPDPRQPGFNYMEVCRLTWRDARLAVQFLQKNGLPAMCVPVSKVDPATAQANNAIHLVFVLDGIPSGQYRANEAKRAELKATIQKLGKRWQREERGASDFGDPSWVLFRGGK